MHVDGISTMEVLTRSQQIRYTPIVFHATRIYQYQMQVHQLALLIIALEEMKLLERKMPLYRACGNLMMTVGAKGFKIGVLCHDNSRL